ncbi:penicillin acylase family protein [Roseomonas sp. OT10]|uniref:penicillin acylase family protein n=1 Tax=Roseomonas cutis TaxID=2897332 RepID=UPI001E4DE956|nr:penicillin acylase family protein [Roseomonas sp. OT10]UFN50772.1 penicillin acylase family protein [Roseomonas sp. OT10]
MLSPADRQTRRRPSRWRRFLRRLAFVLVALPVLAAIALAGALWWTLPSRDGRLALPGLSAPVDIAIDAQGIPRITAATETDAAMALGVLHARDRLFQMDMMRRTAAGRLAEVAGPSALRLDRFSRTLGLARRAEADLAAQAPETRALLDAYAAGVNAWIAARGRFAAPEYLALGAPEPWRPRDSLLWGKLMGLYLSGNWRTELERARLAPILPPDRLEELWPADASSGRAEVAALDAGPLDRLLAALPRFPEDAPLPETASNAWAVAAERSATGGALLASDPHLGFSAPVLWYLARIELPGGRFLAGATAPGVPGVVIGRSDRLAWGFTTTHSDTQDVFVERPVGTDSYETPDGPRPFATREELIAIRGAPPEQLLVRETRHGPVISDLDPPGGEGTPRILAVAMANLAPGDTAPSGLHALNRARSLEEARRAVAAITSPSQNVMVADAAGPVAMFLSGRTPLRRAGDGNQPAPGWDGSHDWTGWVPFDALPHVVAPESGAVANANNRVQPEGAEVFLGRDWFGDWRFRRIAEVLASRPRHAPGDFVALQSDAVSLFARDLLPVLRRLPRPGGLAGQARDLLQGWDGEMAADRPQPLIFNAWWREAARLAMAEGGLPAGAWSPRPEFLRMVLTEEQGARWCGSRGCDALAAAALEQAVAALAGRFGQDPTAWRWGEAHQARFEHPLLRFLPVLGRLTSLAVPMAGDGNTVLRGGYRDDFLAVQGAGLRLVANLASPDGLLASIATGQSGNPLSRHWSDLNPLWANGRALRLGRDAEAEGRLRLEPAAAR